MDYFEKLENNPYADLQWNIPERKQGAVNIIGGNSQSFRAEVKSAEFLSAKYPIESIRLVLPDALQGKLPPLPDVKYLKSTESGSFASSEELTEVINAADWNLLMGDLSKNTTTRRVVASACENSERPLLITRDGVDALAEDNPGMTLMNEKITIMGSVAQLQKLLRAVYYPKMLLMSQSLVQVVDVLHKFTLSYPVSIVTLHNEQVLTAKNGLVRAVPLSKSGYSPMMLWQGELASKIVALNLYNPDQFVSATICAIF